MLQEVDKAKGGCEFVTFFATTPEDLVTTYRLYGSLATWPSREKSTEKSP